MEFELQQWTHWLDDYPRVTREYLREKVPEENTRIMTALYADAQNTIFPPYFLKAHLESYISTLRSFLERLKRNPETTKREFLTAHLKKLKVEMEALFWAMHPKPPAALHIHQTDDDSSLPNELLFRLPITTDVALHFLETETTKKISIFNNAEQQIQFLQGIIGYRKFNGSNLPTGRKKPLATFEKDYLEWIEGFIAKKALLPPQKIRIKMTLQSLGILLSLLKSARMIPLMSEKDIATVAANTFECRSISMQKGKKENQILYSFFHDEPRQLESILDLLQKLKRIANTKLNKLKKDDTLHIAITPRTSSDHKKAAS